MKKTIISCMIAAGLASASTSVLAQSGYTATRHPIVLAHGLFGFDQLAGVDYFYGIPSALKSGGAHVFVTQQSAANSSEVRGEQLLAELRRLRAAYGYQKFNLIGHSHGGHSVRYVAAVAPELVASVTTVGTPHHGSPVADAVERITSQTSTTSIVAHIVDKMASLISFLSFAPKLPQYSVEAMRSLTTQGSKAFNVRFPQGAPTTPCGQGPEVVNGVRYYSVSGTAVSTHLFDPSDVALRISSKLIPEANDGLVGRCSSRWGMVLRDDYAWNHMDQVNQAFGMRGLFTPDPVAFYRSHANRLKSLGL